MTQRLHVPNRGLVRAALVLWIALAALVGAWAGWSASFLPAPRGAWFFFVIAILAAIGMRSAVKTSRGPGGLMTASVAAITLTAVALVSHSSR